MLIQWEQGNSETKKLWSKMNDWVYKGFEKTYSDLGVSFDSIYYAGGMRVFNRTVAEGQKRGLLFSSYMPYSHRRAYEGGKVFYPIKGLIRPTLTMRERKKTISRSRCICKNVNSSFRT